MYTWETWQRFNRYIASEEVMSEPTQFAEFLESSVSQHVELYLQLAEQLRGVFIIKVDGPARTAWTIDFTSVTPKCVAGVVPISDLCVAIPEKEFSLILTDRYCGLQRLYLEGKVRIENEAPDTRQRIFQLQRLLAIGVERSLTEQEAEQERLEAMVGPPGVWTDSQAFQIDFLMRIGVQPHHDLLDVGCGVLRGGIPLIRYLDPGHYTGIDVRARAIEEARLQTERHGLTDKHPRLLVSSSFG